MPGYCVQQNAGKRDVSIDLNVPGARERALRPCDTADVVVENCRAGTLRLKCPLPPSAAAASSNTFFVHRRGSHLRSLHRAFGAPRRQAKNALRYAVRPHNFPCDTELIAR